MIRLQVQNIISIFRKIIFLIFYRPRFQVCGVRSFIARPFISLQGTKNIRIGNYTQIGKNARIEAITKYSDEYFTPLIEIGDHVMINQNFHCTCAAKVAIRKGTSITANCGVFDIIHPYTDIDVNPRDARIKVKPVEIGENCLIGMNSVILPGTILGNHCIVGANSVVCGFFPSYTVLAGNPAKVIKYYDSVKKEWVKNISGN